MYEIDLDQRLAWLRSMGSLAETLDLQKVTEASAGLDDTVFLKVIQNYEDKSQHGQLKNPTSWVCAALCKERQGASAHSGKNWGSPEGELRERLQKMNTEGGFEGALDESQVVEAAQGLDGSIVAKALSNLEDKYRRGEVRNPTSFVCAALAKERQGQPAHFGKNWGAAQSPVEAKIAWMNSGGGFNYTLDQAQILEAAAGMDDLALKVLGNLEDFASRAQVKNPTSWVCAALCKERRGMPAHNGKNWDGAAAVVEQVDELTATVAWLNGEGGFRGSVQLQPIAELATGMDPQIVQGVLKKCMDKQAQLRDPTSWVCAALVKEQNGQAAHSGKNWGGVEAAQPAQVAASASTMGAELSAEVHILQGTVDMDQVLEVATGMDELVVLQVLRKVQDRMNRSPLDNPTSWVCNALCKEKQGKSPQGQASFVASDPREEMWRQVQFLNTQGGFNNAINGLLVQEAAVGLDMGVVMEVLRKVQDKLGEVRDATSWICAALCKEKKGLPPRSPVTGAPPQGLLMPSWSSSAPPSSLLAPSGRTPSAPSAPPRQLPRAPPAPAPALRQQGARPKAPVAPPSSAPKQAIIPDPELWNAIKRLNTEGGFQNQIDPYQVGEAAHGLDQSTVSKVLSNLQDKQGQVKDPTSWVCAALCKEKRGMAGLTGIAGKINTPFQGGSGNPEGEIRGRVAWLNGEGGLQGALDVEQIAQASAGLDTSLALKALANVEDKCRRGEVRNPTSFVCAALAKERQGLAAHAGRNWTGGGGGTDGFGTGAMVFAGRGVKRPLH
mmetsp:Transcript_82852/g.268437  ORF Transcript_82852/g.268437 Transcript_82852/m.268437 type:complete len:781 (+) Transcript_82852:90-2432(+)